MYWFKNFKKWYNTRNLKQFKPMTKAEAFYLLQTSFHCMALGMDFRSTLSEKQTKKCLSKSRKLTHKVCLPLDCSAKHRREMRHFLVCKNTATELCILRHWFHWMILCIQIWKLVSARTLERTELWGLYKAYTEPPQKIDLKLVYSLLLVVNHLHLMAKFCLKQACLTKRETLN